MKKKIDIIVVSRADLYPLLPIINKKSDNISYRIISTGSLLTKNQIESCKDINTKYKKIFISSEKDGEFDIINNISDGIKKFSKFYKNKKPEAILVLGDRFELLVVAIISIIYGIPIAHIHGGEITEGSFDNTIRHCISKVATLHFVSNLIYKKRLIQMGEQPKNIFISGAPGLDHVNTGLKNKKYLEKKYNFNFSKKNILFTLHPETITKNHRKYILNFIEFLNKNEEYLVIFTSSNSDTDYKFINNVIRDFVEKNKNRSLFIKNLGKDDYKSMIRVIDCVIGNSSSGIIEVPTFKKPTINIGERQKGRIFAESIINIKGDYVSLEKSIVKAFSKKFQKKIRYVKNPYFKKNASQSINNVLKGYNFKNNLKKFYDLY